MIANGRSSTYDLSFFINLHGTYFSTSDAAKRIEIL